jgi:hypothetical protein
MTYWQRAVAILLMFGSIGSAASIHAQDGKAGSAQAKFHTPQVQNHECFLHSPLTCNSGLTDEIDIFGCRYVTSSETRYYNRHQIYLATRTTVQVTVTATDFIPELGIAYDQATSYLVFNANTARANRVTITQQVQAGMLDIDVFAKPPYEGNYTVTITCTPCIEPFVQQQPELEVTVPYGSTFDLSVTAGGNQPIQYKWLDITTTLRILAFTNTYRTPPVTTRVVYQAEISNECGTIKSREVTLMPGACPTPILTRVDVPPTAKVNSGVTATITASGPAPLSYQWFIGFPPDTSHPVAAPSSNPAMYLQSGPVPTSFRVWARVTNACGASVNSTSFPVTVEGSSKRRAAQH